MGDQTIFPDYPRIVAPESINLEPNDYVILARGGLLTVDRGSEWCDRSKRTHMDKYLCRDFPGFAPGGLFLPDPDGNTRRGTS